MFRSDVRLRRRGLGNPCRGQRYHESDEKTNLGNPHIMQHMSRAERFVALYGHLPMRAVDDRVVREYRRAGHNDGTIPALRAMFNDAMRADAGRLVAVNPFANLRVAQSRGRRDVQRPAEAEAARMVALADEQTRGASAAAPS